MQLLLPQLPKEWNSLLNIFKPEFSKPQFVNFSQSVTAIAISHFTSISRFSNLGIERDQSSLNRFFVESPWDDKRIKSLFQHKIISSFKGLRIGIIDDTLSHKPFAKKMELLGNHYDGLNGGYCQGHSLVNCGYVHKDEFIPFDIAIYTQKETNPLNFRTKNQIAVSMLKQQALVGKPSVIVMDAWYSNKIIIEQLKKQGTLFVTQIKSNRNVTIDHKNRSINAHKKHIELSNFKTLSINKRIFRIFECDGFISKIGTVRILFTQIFLENGEWSEIQYLITNIFSSSTEFIIDLYLRRWSIEVFHRETKQHLGLEDYFVRKSRGIERYLFLVILTYTLLMLLIPKQKDAVESITLGERCRKLRGMCLTTFAIRAKALNKTQTAQKMQLLATAI